MFLIQQVEILQDVAKVTEGLEIGHVNLIDNGDGGSIPRYVGAYPAIVTKPLTASKTPSAWTPILTAGNRVDAHDAKEGR